MNNSLNIVSQLIGYLNQFETEKGEESIDIKDFILWLNGVLFDQYHDVKTAGEENNLNSEITFLLIMQSKHFKMYCKKALQDSEINTPDDYSFLYHLSLVDSYRKMELINIHLLEAPSGIEVLKRLFKKGLIEEFDDKQDKRAKRVKITEKGDDELKKLNPIMLDVYKKMTAEMSFKEKLHIVAFLKAFNNYHLNNYK